HQLHPVRALAHDDRSTPTGRDVEHRPDLFELPLRLEPPDDLAGLIEDEPSAHRSENLHRWSRTRVLIETGSRWRTVQPVSCSRRLNRSRRNTSPSSPTP